MNAPAAGPKGANTSIVKAYADEAGIVHLVNGSGKDFAVPKEKNQVGAEQIAIAEDKQTVGWLILYHHGYTSYPIPLMLVIYRNGKIIQRINDGLMISSWQFRGAGKQVALSSGTVHGMQHRSLSLYDVLTRRVVKQWNGDLEATPPVWGQGLR